MVYWISPNFNTGQFPHGLTLDEKIEVFEDRVQGWQLGIADHVQRDIPHSGFAVLGIVLSYFEMVAKYRDGYTKADKSKDYFKEGVGWVFPGLPLHPLLLDRLYESVRCAMYHGGLTGPEVQLTGDIRQAMAASSDGQTVIVNPHRLVPALQQHFGQYVAELKEPSHEKERTNFERRFDSGAKRRLILTPRRSGRVT